MLDDKKIQELYNPLILGDDLIDKIIEAHKTVLKVGKTSNTEYAITICCETNATKIHTIGNHKSVAYLCEPDKSYIVIHNHPNNTPFSPRDLFSFYSGIHHKSLGVQCHDGTAYIISRGTLNNTAISFDKISEVFDRVRDAPEYINLTLREKREIAIFLIARRQGWVFLKGALI
ncbi:MAG: hypothetical protein FWE90_04820 [Defluviitaleaceae bacterium]|nr:hypothetical protein [Defluviitaleaceae bacterium]